MKANYHTHTARCQHAEGTDEAYVRAGLEAGYELLGFADHAPWPFPAGYRSRIRMSCDELPGYTMSLKTLQRQYDGQIRIRIGLEAEYWPRYADALPRLMEQGIEYLILGHHFNDSEEDTPYNGGQACLDDSGALRYAETIVRAMQTGLFVCVAHPDLFLKRRMDYTPACEAASDMICQAALELHMPLEYNLLGLNIRMHGGTCGYPSGPFWQRAAHYGNTVIVGVDAHSPAQLLDREVMRAGMEHLRSLGIQPIECLPEDA